MDQVIIEQLKPKTVNHENSLLYCSLKECIKTNAELREALVEATEMIFKLTAQIEGKHES